MYLDEGGCGNYRIKLPLTHLSEVGAQVHLVKAYLEGFTLAGFDLSVYTHIIVQRATYPHNLKLLHEAKARGVSIVYEIDDNLHRIHPSSKAYPIFKPGSDALKVVDEIITISDAMIVSTPDLASQYAYKHPKIFVLPNYLSFQHQNWNCVRPKPDVMRDKVVIGWAGSHTHQEDYLPLKGVLSDVLKTYDNTVFACCSSYSMMEEFVKVLELPKDKVVLIEPMPFNQFPIVLTPFDIGLAPLKDTSFNRAKSDLKLKEYGAKSIPYIATDCAPYRRFHNDTFGCGGFLARGGGDWEQALHTLVADSQERRNRGRLLRKIIEKRYLLRDNVIQWGETLRKIRQGDYITSWSQMDKPGRNKPCPCGKQRKYKTCCYPAFG